MDTKQVLEYRELDKRVALEVMNWKPVTFDDEVIVAFNIGEGKELFFTDPSQSDNQWSPSTNIVDSEKVIQYLKDKCEFFSLDYEDGKWTCEFGLEYSGEHEVEADTITLAITLASLKSFGERK